MPTKSANKIQVVIKIVVFLTVIIVTCLTFIQHKNINTESISPRTKEFLEKNYPNFREEAVKDNSNTIYSTECFQVQIPYISSNPKLEKEGKKCVFQAKVLKPQSQIVIYNEALTDDINSNSGITMRRQFKQTYKESYLKYQQVLRFDAKDSVVFFAKENTNLITIAFNNISNPANVKNEDIIKILESFKFL